MSSRSLPGLLSVLLTLASLVGPARGVDAQEVLRPDLAGIATGTGWTVTNRAATVGTEGEHTVVTFDAQPGDGAAWLDGVEFHNGTIEVLIRGKNNPGQSFVGVAFRGVDEQTYDAIYFRPFNFLADNDLSRSHMVQYISHPEYTWSRLREEHTDMYENPLPHPPNPDQFFKARIEISKLEVRVYVGDETEPCLVVNELSGRTGGRVGLWMGNGSDGSFAELVIRPAGG
ncbi:MAG: hypothetical protein MUO50_09330 [Longimicrobiales bacterium]|nr:hypothetical protein [Longimicrobiales bacterium]